MRAMTLDDQPCVECGRPVDMNKLPVTVYTKHGGTLCTKDEMEQSGDGWEMPVGPDCYRKNKAKYANYIAK